jgi:aconitate hydratase
MQNLVNFGVLPLVFDDPADYDKIDADDTLVIENIKVSIVKNQITVTDKTKGIDIPAHHVMSQHHVELVLEGGLLRFIQNHQND